MCGLGNGLGRLAPGLRAARLVAHRDEQRGDVFAVLPRLRERRARAVRLNALGRQIDAHRVGLGVGAFDTTLCAGFRHLHVFDDATPRVVETTQERSGPQQAPEAAIAER
jgi:hypothetical protein